MFTITGIIAGEQEYITYHWNNGVGSYEGSPLAAFLLEGAQERTSPVGPVGQPLDRDINDPVAALFMIRECFDRVLTCEGDIPQAAPIPDGAIG